MRQKKYTQENQQRDEKVDRLGRRGDTLTKLGVAAGKGCSEDEALWNPQHAVTQQNQILEEWLMLMSDTQQERKGEKKRKKNCYR